LLRLAPTREIGEALEKVRKLGCNTVSLEAVGCYAIDVPETLEMTEIDQILNELDGEKVGIAFPSFRHEDTETEEE
jgi:tRNA threonylcarbamoyladenosine modification (KEOPS) complex Cgi121 subunit